MEPIITIEGYQMLQNSRDSRNLLNNFYRDQGYQVVSANTAPVDKFRPEEEAPVTNEVPVVSVTEDDSATAKKLFDAWTEVKKAFEVATSRVQKVDVASEKATRFNEMVETLTKNLDSLNTIAELELKDKNNHLKSLNSYYIDLDKASKEMLSSVEEAQKTRNEMAGIASKMERLKLFVEGELSKKQYK
jgi:hypothetical protein